MKTTLTIALMLMAGALGAQNKLTMKIEGIGQTKGRLMVAIFDQQGYEGFKPVAAKAIEASACNGHLTFENIPSGDYAALLFIDENGNNFLDMNSDGVPTEKYGFSNNIQPQGMPAFGDLKFTVGPQTLINIMMRGAADQQAK